MQAELTSPTRQRLLDAAFRVCSEQGIHGATTREIADVAGVNEVTLFRHFGNKEKLIAALFEHVLANLTESLNITEVDAHDLERDIFRYALRYHEMLTANEALIRTILGEAKRHPEQARQVMCEAGRSLRERLIDYLRAAQNAGSVREDVDLGPALDAFTGMLLAGMLRRTSFKSYIDYSADEYLHTVVDLFLRGIAATPSPDKPLSKAQSA
ncbi:transcriptional regulator, TetR family [Chthoniobacter flavus Ellin428]|uniref:Transcriptional regulator, TetR family n=1 Tax=Chthoniobacter flavus Ellin428 TaxID=497964 RepID=B4D6M1_9BACT|nr:TetR/AcrR family transcriptional regulator [Chthoniobacter flavus]EDY17822.1 transcriptional regulator, TetR family [Chthoniobacter flavus Ellin428]